MKSTITIEQFDNGISILQDYEDGDTQGIVTLDTTKEKDLGKLLMADISNVMDAEVTNKVQVEINIIPVRP